MTIKIEQDTVDFVMAYMDDQEIENCGGITSNLNDRPICDAVFQALIYDVQAAEQLADDLRAHGIEVEEVVHEVHESHFC